MTKEEQKNLITDLNINLLRLYVFYGHILSQVTKVAVSGEDAKIKTFGTGKKNDEKIVKLYYNSEYLDSTVAEFGHNRAYINFFEMLKHEVLHIIFGHHGLNLPDKARLAVACDLSVNSYLSRDMFVSTKKNTPLFAEDFGLETKQTAIWYYQKLIDNPKFQKMANDLNNSSIVDSHSFWESIANDPIAQNSMKDLVGQAKDFCDRTKTWGKTPGDLIELLTDLLEIKKPKLPWQKVLRMFVASHADTELDYTMRRASRRFGCRPGTKKLHRLKLAIGIDTSGSISNEQLSIFFNEMKWIEKDGASIHVYECDTEIGRDYPFREFDGKITGRGGTDLEPVLQEVADEKYDALIFFTDFYTPEIKTDYGIPVLWVLSECSMEKEQFPYLFPRNVYIKIDTDDDGCELIS